MGKLLDKLLKIFFAVLIILGFMLGPVGGSTYTPRYVSTRYRLWEVGEELEEYKGRAYRLLYFGRRSLR